MLRTPVMQREAATGKRLSRMGGSEYSAPTARPAATAAVSAAPCVTAMASGTTLQAATIPLAAVGERSPAATGRYGLLTRSMSTSVSWLTPTMATLTASPAVSGAGGSPGPRAVAPPAAAGAYNPAVGRRGAGVVGG